MRCQKIGYMLPCAMQTMVLPDSCQTCLNKQSTRLKEADLSLTGSRSFGDLESCYGGSKGTLKYILRVEKMFIGPFSHKLGYRPLYNIAIQAMCQKLLFVRKIR